MFLTTLRIAALCSCALAARTDLYVYELLDAASNDNYPMGSKEFHCFDSDGGQTTYVRGTYGHFGYFEGAVDAMNNHTFHVNWYESASGTLTPTMGSATLTYSDNFEEVNGTFWSSGRSDIMDSYGAWYAASGTYVTDDDANATASELMLRRCLYPGAAAADDRDDIDELHESYISSFSQDGGGNNFRYMQASGAGAWLGVYQFVYDGSDDAIGEERGNYGVDSFAFWVQSGMGFVGTWIASSGPFKGEHGSSLYMVVSENDAPKMVGFYCDVDENDIRTDCYEEAYEVIDQDFNVCPQWFKMEDTLDPLYKFAAKGSSKDECDDYDASSSPELVLAVLFGIFAFFLVLVIAYLMMKLKHSHARVTTSSSKQNLAA